MYLLSSPLLAVTPISSCLCYQLHSHQGVIIGLGVSWPCTTYIHMHTHHIHTQAHRPTHLFFFRTSMFVHLSCVCTTVWMCPVFLMWPPGCFLAAFPHHFGQSLPFQKLNLKEALSSARNSLMCITSPFLLQPSPYQWTCIVRGIARVMNCSGGGQKCNGNHTARGETKWKCLLWSVSYLWCAP